MTNLTLQNADICIYYFRKNDNRVVIEYLQGGAKLWFVRVEQIVNGIEHGWRATYSVNAHSENEALTVAKSLYEQL